MPSKGGTSPQARFPGRGPRQHPGEHGGCKVYILLAPVKEDGDDVYTLRFPKNASNAPAVSRLKPLFEEAGITLRPDVWYDLESTLVEDEAEKTGEEAGGESDE